MKKLIIVGAGGHGKSVAEAILSSSEFELVGFLDDSYKIRPTVLDYPVWGSMDMNSQQLIELANYAIVAIGNNSLREKLQTNLIDGGLNIATIIHPKAIVSPRAQIGIGSTIMAGSIIGTCSKLGKGVIVNCGAVIDHDCEAMDYSHLGVGTCMAGGSILGRGAWMHAGSALGYGTIVNDMEIVHSPPIRQIGT